MILAAEAIRISYEAQLSVEKCTRPTRAPDNFAEFRNSYGKTKFFFNVLGAK